MERVAVNGTHLNVRIDQAGVEAPWIVFANSLVTDLSIWDAVAGHLRGRYNLLRYNQRGHGGSDSAEGPVDFETLGADLLGVMAAAGVKRATAVGLSMGVPTVLSAYGAAPERFDALVLIDGQAASAANASETWGGRIAAARAEGMEAWARATAARWLTSENHADKLERLAAMIAATPFAGFEAGATVLKGYDFKSVLPRISVPVLALAGAEDGAMPETMARVFGCLPGARFEAIPGAGHVPCFERPEAVNEALDGFLAAEVPS